MSILQRQVIQSLNGLLDDNLRFCSKWYSVLWNPPRKKRKMLTSWLWIKNCSKNWQFGRSGSYWCRLWYRWVQWWNCRDVWSVPVIKILIDTHIAIWAVLNDPKLPGKAKELLLDMKKNLLYRFKQWTTHCPKLMGLQLHYFKVEGDRTRSICCINTERLRYRALEVG